MTVNQMGWLFIGLGSGCIIAMLVNRHYRLKGVELVKKMPLDDLAKCIGLVKGEDGKYIEWDKYVLGEDK